MDLLSLLIILIFAAGAIVSIVFGIKFLIKYKKTRSNLHLFLGILLTFIVPAILFFVVFKGLLPNTMIDYGPGPMVAYGPGPI